MAELTAETLELIRRISSLARNGHDIREFFRQVTELCVDISGADDTTIMLLDQDQSALVVTACHGPEDELRRVTFPVGEGIAGRVLETGESERFDDVVGDPQFVSLPWQEGRIHSLLVVPIRTADRIVGVLSCHASAVGVFGETEHAWIELVARQLAADIDNAWLRETTTIDPLTRVMNRGHFLHRLDMELRRTRRHASDLTLLAIDIDHFSAVNDLQGKFVGDMVLREFARRVAEEVRGEDIFARYSGELFLLLLPHTSLVAAEKIAERIRGRITSRAFRSRRGAIPCTVSIGVAAASADSSTPDQLIDSSRRALRYAKKHGRNRVVLAQDVPTTYVDSGSY